MLKLTIILVFLALVAADKKYFDKYQVFRVFPTNELQIEFLKRFNEYHDDEYNFWKYPSNLNKSVDLMVGPNKIEEFAHHMDESGIEFENFVENVQTLIDNENPLDNFQSKSHFDWTCYGTLEEIYEYLYSLANAYPDKVEVIIGGYTYEGRSIKGVKLSFNKNNPGVFIEGGTHAREWIAPATVTYILNELLTSNDPEVRELAERHDWYIFPSFNPDGYVYTHTTDRLWRKSMKPSDNSCIGTDLNRNWDFKWMEGGASNDSCDETFAGSSPFSDIETRTLSEYITSISNKIYAYIAFHSYSQLLLFPYGSTTEHLDNYDELLAIGTKTIAALAKRYGTEYVTGSIAETIYVATGSSLDWVKSNFKFPITYGYELRDTGKYGFLLPANQIIPTGQETLDSLVELFKEAANRGLPRSC